MTTSGGLNIDMTSNLKKMTYLTSFDLQDIDLESPHMHKIEFPVARTTYSPNVVVLVLLGSEISGG